MAENETSKENAEIKKRGGIEAQRESAETG